MLHGTSDDRSGLEFSMNMLDRRRRLRHIGSFSLCLLASSTLAEATPATGARPVSGGELIRLLEGKGDDGGCLDERCRQLSSARGRTYVQGVADSSRGQWCGHGEVLPHELIDRVFSYIRQLPSNRMKQNASDLIIEGLSAELPCRSRASYEAESGRGNRLP